MSLPFTVDALVDRAERRRGEEERAARAWVALLESVVREHPTQWFNFFDIWNPVLA